MDAVDPGTIIAGRYKVVGEIGRGGMGVVYRVEHVHTGERLALKVLIGAAKFDPQAVARFKREARASAQIRSEHVVRVTDADTATELGGSPFLVMELLNGVDLEQFIVRRGALSTQHVVTLMTQVGRVLSTAHSIGIIHRDLKPENLFLHEREDGNTIAKLLDFGISKFVSADHALEAAGMTSTGSVLGTPLYMAPEQAHGHNDKINSTTDIWALGLVAMRLMTAEHFWGVPTMVELMMQIAVKPIPAPSARWPNDSRMSPALDAWFLRSCNRDQSLRWQSVDEQVSELAVALRVDRVSAVSILDLRVNDVGAPVSGKIPGKSDDEQQRAIELAETEDGKIKGDDGEPTHEAPAVSEGGSKSLAAEASITASEKALSRSNRISAIPQKRTRFIVIGGAAAIVVGTVALFSWNRTPTTTNTSSPSSSSSPSPLASSAPSVVIANDAPDAMAVTPSSSMAVASASASSSPATSASTRAGSVGSVARGRPRASASASASAAVDVAASSAAAPVPAGSSSTLYAPLSP